MLQTGSLTVSRDFIDVEDVASALHRLATHPLACGVVNICSGKPTRLDGLVELLITVSGKPVPSNWTRLGYGARNAAPFLVIRHCCTTSRGGI